MFYIGFFLKIFRRIVDLKLNVYWGICFLKFEKKNGYWYCFFFFCCLKKNSYCGYFVFLFIYEWWIYIVMKEKKIKIEYEMDIFFE